MPTQKTKEPRILIWDREELAWVGGFFSGEGYIRVQRERRQTKKYGERVYKVPVLCVSQAVSPWPLEKIRDALGLGRITGPYKQTVRKNKDYWTLTIGGFQVAQAAIAMLWPWLSPVKQEQAVKTLREMVEYNASIGKGKRSCQP